MVVLDWNSPALSTIHLCVREDNDIDLLKAKRYIDPRPENDHPLGASQFCKASLKDRSICPKTSSTFDAP